MLELTEEEDVSDVGESLHFSEESDFEANQNRLKRAIKADEYNFTDDDTDPGNYPVGPSSPEEAEEEPGNAGERDGGNGEETGREYPKHRDTVVSPKKEEEEEEEKEVAVVEEEVDLKAIQAKVLEEIERRAREIVNSRLCQSFIVC